MMNLVPLTTLVLACGIFLAAIALTAVLRHAEAAASANVDLERATDRIDALLPQTQCEQCGFKGCRPYARAIAAGQADINRCPPGGEVVIGKLAELLGAEVRALDRSRGEPGPPRIAVVDEAICIGCTKCIPPCPTDAIIGAPGQIHQVIAERCTGCELCLPPCPVDCIELVPSHA